jgi:hypothetical protein
MANWSQVDWPPMPGEANQFQVGQLSQWRQLTYVSVGEVKYAQLAELIERR